MRQNKIFICLTHFIFISIIIQTYETNNKSLERIENGIRFIFSNIEGLIDGKSFSLLYEKYNITFNNLRILKPFINGHEIYEEKNNNDIYYSLNDIILDYKAEVDIQIFSEYSDVIKHGNIFFKINFENIKFKLINDLRIKFEESKIKFVNYSFLSELNFFTDFNQMKNCTFHETGKDTIDIDDLNSKLKEYFNEAFVEKIKEIEKNFNLLTYDLIQILDYNQA